MKKRFISLFLAICLLAGIFSTTAFASSSSESTGKTVYYGYYTALGDSICAGFTQPDYQYKDGFAVNPENSPKLCYASLVGDQLGSTVYNLGKCGSDTGDLLDILTNGNNSYHDEFTQYIRKSNLITLEMGSDDLLMATAHSIMKCVGGNVGDMTTEQMLALVEPLLTGDIGGIANSIETVMGVQLTPEQIQAIMNALSDDSLKATLETAYESYCVNYPQIVKELHDLNPDAEIVILNYYNPYSYLNFNWGYTSANTVKIIQDFTDKMNAFALKYSQDNDHPYVDLSGIQTNIVDPHPSTAGHAQIASRIVSALLKTVTATAQDGGTITPAGKNAVKYRGALTLSIAAKSGYDISDVLVDGVSVGAVKTYTFTNVKADHLITANFRRADATDPTNADTGTTTPSGATPTDTSGSTTTSTTAIANPATGDNAPTLPVYMAAFAALALGLGLVLKKHLV